MEYHIKDSEIVSQVSRAYNFLLLAMPVYNSKYISENMKKVKACNWLIK
jgi:hypothetical protein